MSNQQSQDFRLDGGEEANNENSVGISSLASSSSLSFTLNPHNNSNNQNFNSKPLSLSGSFSSPSASSPVSGVLERKAQERNELEKMNEKLDAELLEMEKENEQLRRKNSNNNNNSQQESNLRTLSTQQLSQLFKQKHRELESTKIETGKLLFPKVSSLQELSSSSSLDASADDHEGEYEKQGNDNHQENDDENEKDEQEEQEDDQEEIPSSQEVNKLVAEIAPQVFLQEHSSLAESLFAQLCASHSSLLYKDEKQRLESEISKMTNSLFASLLEGEKESRAFLVTSEGEERFGSVAQQFRSLCFQSKAKFENSQSDLNERGAHLQRTLPTKKELLGQKRGLLSIAEQDLVAAVGKQMTFDQIFYKNLRKKQDEEGEETELSVSTTSAAAAASGGDDEGISNSSLSSQHDRLLMKLQNEFAELQNDLYLRPTFEDTGLQRYKDQILHLTQELTKNRELLSKAGVNQEGEDEIEEDDDEETESGAKYLRMFHRLESEVEARQKQRVSLTEQIENTRDNISKLQDYWTNLKVEEQRESLQQRRSELDSEIESLRDKLCDNEDFDF